MSAPSPAAARPTSLPTILTPVLGRTRELDGVMALLDDPSQRLVTLTGPGGVGKTRLALHIASTLTDEFERDVVYVALAAIRDPDLVLPSIGQALGLLLDANDAHQERLVEALHDRPMLLVLDNFEQLLDAAPALASILAHCPELTILVTSQAALGIVGEQLYPLAPLPTPNPDQTTAASILDSEAVALFVARARAVKPTLVLDDRTAVTIAEICRRLDGLPLAIELAAARSTILSPEALLARLSNRLQVLGGERRGVPDRLRTMRHAIAWSYDLLTPPEQDLFRHLAVFAGGIALEAVEAIVGPVDGDRDAFGVLSALVDHSLVRVDPHPAGDPRFLILETLREYGLEQLELRGETDATRFAHATWCLNLAETAEPHLYGPEQETWLNRLDPEWENIRAASNWTLDHDHPEITARIFGAIWQFCSTRGHVIESRGFLDRALAAIPEDQTTIRARALVAAGNLAEYQRDQAVARKCFDQARTIALAIDNPQIEIRTLAGLAKVAVNQSDFATAIEHHEQAAHLAREVGDLRSVGTSLGGLAYVAYFQGNLDEAVRNWEEARQIVASIGDTLLESVAASNLGAVATDRGEYDVAEQRLSRALDLQRRMQDAKSLPYTLTNLAITWRHLGDLTLSDDLFAEAIALFRQFGFKGSEGTCLASYAELAFAQGDTVGAAAMLIESTRLIHEVGDQFPLTENADVLAELCIERGNVEAAIELLAASATICKALGAEQKPVQLARIEELHTQLRASIGDQEYDRHWQVGAGHDLEMLVRRVTIIAREIVGAQQPQPVFPTVELQVQHPLTARELQVLHLLAQGKSTRTISDELYISPRTITTHVNNIFGKLEVNNRTAAVAWALRAGLV